MLRIRTYHARGWYNLPGHHLKKVMVFSPGDVLTRNEAIFYFTDCQVVIKDYWKASQVTINDETITFPTPF